MLLPASSASGAETREVVFGQGRGEALAGRMRPAYVCLIRQQPGDVLATRRRLRRRARR